MTVLPPCPGDVARPTGDQNDPADTPQHLSDTHLHASDNQQNRSDALQHSPHNLRHLSGVVSDHTSNLLQPQQLRWILLDIEGTTCPVSFVASTLFPYASNHLSSFLEESGHLDGVRSLLAEIDREWSNDADPTAVELRTRRLLPSSPAELLPYLLLLINQDRKLTPLKELQGMVWEQGYKKGELQAPLFEDVPEALNRWHQAGLGLAVYSSGSVTAQQLLYAHTQAGDLTPLFKHWFDTRIGPKRERESYTRIANALDCPPSYILFISDIADELKAAYAAGFNVLFSLRHDNPEIDPQSFTVIKDYTHLQPHPFHNA